MFTREDGTQRQSIIVDSRLTMTDPAALINVNPLHKLMRIAQSSANGFRSGLAWLSLFACSGVDIPLSIFQDLASATSKFKATLQDCTVLIKACLYSTWLRSIGRQDLQATVAVLLEYLEPQILNNLRSHEAITET